MTLKAVYACDGCGRMEATESDAARGWVQVYVPRVGATAAADEPDGPMEMPLMSRDRHFCGYPCVEEFARREQAMAEQIARLKEGRKDSRGDSRDEPGATQPGTRKLSTAAPLFRPSHGKHGNADEALDGEVIHKDTQDATDGHKDAEDASA